MTDLLEATDGFRRRAVVDQATYDAAPPQAQDPSSPLTLHYWVDPVVNGTALDGARWALSWSLGLLYGDTLATLLEQATLSNVEQWNGSSWELVA